MSIRLWEFISVPERAVTKNRRLFTQNHKIRLAKDIGVFFIPKVLAFQALFEKPFDHRTF
jgi:hypothetical protein